MDLAAEVVGRPYRNRLEDSRANAVARMSDPKPMTVLPTNPQDKCSDSHDLPPDAILASSGLTEAANRLRKGRASKMLGCEKA